MCGRGPLEAAGRGIPLGPNDVAYRVNLTTVVDGVLRDFSGGHVEPDLAAELIALLNTRFGGETIRFHPGVSYRNVLVLRSPPYSEKVATDKPDDNHGERVDAHFPVALTPEAEPTAALLRRLIVEASAVLAQHSGNVKLREAGHPMANGIWPWSGGRAGAIRSLASKYGIATSAVISAVDVIMGLGRCLGMKPIAVPGATGYIDTNYEGKARAAIEALKTHDFVYLHVEAIDEVSHAQDLELKIKTIEDVDARLVAPVLAAIGPDVNVAVLPDHPVPVAIGKHTRVPPPVAVRMRGLAPDDVMVFDEVACKSGSLRDMRNGDLMALLFGAPRA
jgi:2,3-bisphosphoglycerate-independent phosphoglycerate mutase